MVVCGHKVTATCGTQRQGRNVPPGSGAEEHAFRGNSVDQADRHIPAGVTGQQAPVAGAQAPPAPYQVHMDFSKRVQDGTAFMMWHERLCQYGDTALS